MVKKHTGLLDKIVKIVLEMQSHFKDKNPFLEKNSIKCPVFYAQLEGKWTF